MGKLYSNLLFSVAVTLVMNALDMAYHLATGWAVHLDYVAVKLTLIFLTVWMITQFIGRGAEEGIAASIFGPFIFYVYYQFANATLNRSIFRIDDQFWFIFLHLALMLIAYFAALGFVRSKKHWIRSVSFIATAGLASVAMHALMMMARWRLNGIDEESAAKLMTFGVISAPLAAYLAAVAIGVIADNLMKNRHLDMIAAGIIAAILVGLTASWIDGIFAFAFVSISYYMVHNYKKGFIIEA